VFRDGNGAGLIKIRPQPHPRHPSKPARGHTRACTHRVLGGFWATRGFEQSGGEFNHKGMMYRGTKRRTKLVSKINAT
jgi:hypothetical protein